jgi:hypothetical protein
LSFLTKVGNMGFGKMDSAIWYSAIWDSAIWYNDDRNIDLFILKSMGAAIMDFRVCPPLVKCQNLMFSGFIDTLMYGFSSTGELVPDCRIPDCRIPYCRVHFAESHIADTNGGHTRKSIMAAPMLLRIKRSIFLSSFFKFFE